MTRKEWTEEEIQFLKFAYPNKEFTNKEIYKALEPRTKSSITTKASKLGLKRYKEILPYGFKRCSKCKTILPFEDFSIHNQAKDGISSECKLCKRKYNNFKTGAVLDKGAVLAKVCSKCKVEKTLNEFSKNKRFKDGYSYQCKDCRAKYDRTRTITGGYKYND